MESMAQVAGGDSKNKERPEVLALRNTSTSTPDTIVRSVGRRRIFGGKILKKRTRSVRSERKAESNEDVDIRTDTRVKRNLRRCVGFISGGIEVAKVKPRMEHFSFEQGRLQEATSSSQKYQGYGEVSTKKTLKSTSRCWFGNDFVGREYLAPRA